MTVTTNAQRVYLSAILQGVRRTFENQGVMAMVQTLDSLTEGIPDLPLMSIYPESKSTDSRSGSTNRSSFGGGVKQSETTIQVYVHAAMRSNIDEDFTRLVDVVDAVDTVLDEQNEDIFGINGVKSFKWDWNRAIIEYGEPSQKYVGALYTLVFTVF